MDYKNGMIYKLVSNHTDKVYVGSTTRPLRKRKWDHKNSYKNSTKRSYYTAFEIAKYDDFDIILLEGYPCDSKQQLHARERYWIEQLDCVNKTIPTRTHEEYRIDKKDQISETVSQSKTMQDIERRIEKKSENVVKYTGKITKIK
jgi:hypothetical protein